MLDFFFRLPCIFGLAQKCAVAQMCSSSKKKKSEMTRGDGSKKRRLSDNDTSSTGMSVEFMLSLQPILGCLEWALRADAKDGGKWIRADDGARYRSLLEPLGKLLQARVPEEFPVVQASEGAQDPFLVFVVHGGGQHDSPGAVADVGVGSVIGCLSALANAAGNEQLWKPLNHAVLEACSCTTASEIRKGGLICLLSLMKSLGEEYMVLLPECLPVLSELLEDTDELVANLAQDCITLGEELLGESLEDNIR